MSEQSSGDSTDRSVRREWLDYCNALRLAQGMPALRTIADSMNLTSATRVNDLLRGRKLPVDDDQAAKLLAALGADQGQQQIGMRLYRAARAESRNTAWWSRSGYRALLDSIAPDDLTGREAELAELAEWCTNGSERYVWWQAPALAGKSALMSWFVLHPPPGIRVISFFVTARLAGQ